MNEVLDRVRRTIERFGLLGRDRRVLIALSGGSDSVALADLLCRLDEYGELRVVAFAHFNHQLRASSNADERFCQELAARLERPIVCESGDVAGRARAEHHSIEDAARRARHEYLERARAQHDADVIALGHTRDDQAETYLLRMLRGAGARGLASMHPRNGRLVRPLIECRRDQLREYLTSRGLTWVTDESNVDVTIPRNRIRAELLPLLATRFNPRIVDVLADEAELAREEWEWIHDQAAVAASRVCRASQGEWRIDVEALAREPKALQRFLLHGLLTEAAGQGTVSFAHVNAVIDLMRKPAGSLAMPRHRVQRVGSELVLTNRRSEPPEHTGQLEHPQEIALPVPGEVAWGAQWLSAEFADSADKQGGGLVGHGRLAVVCREAGEQGLRVRRRRPGDRFRPLGLGGVKKLQDFFVDRKVPAADREMVPLVVDADDRIVWVAGYAVDDQFRVTDSAQAVIILRLKVLGGSA